MNPNLTITGSGDFALIIGTTTPPATEADYNAASAMFGNVTKTVMMNEHEAKEHFGAYRGVRLLDKRKITKVRKSYKVTTDEVDLRAVRLAFFGNAGAATGTTPNYDTVVPFGNPQSLRGMARLRMWDVEDQTNPVLIHKDFYCVVTPDGDLEVGEEDATLTLRIDVLSPVGTVYLRQRT